MLGCTVGSPCDQLDRTKYEKERSPLVCCARAACRVRILKSRWVSEFGHEKNVAHVQGDRHRRRRFVLRLVLAQQTCRILTFAPGPGFDAEPRVREIRIRVYVQHPCAAAPQLLPDEQRLVEGGVAIRDRRHESESNMLSPIHPKVAQDVHALPSQQGTHPPALLTALYAGTPCNCWRKTGIRAAVHRCSWKLALPPSTAEPHIPLAPCSWTGSLRRCQ